MGIVLTKSMVRLLFYCSFFTVNLSVYFYTHHFLNTVFDLISEHVPFFFFFFIYLFILILIIISSDFREGNTSLLYTGLMATRVR